MKKLKLFIFITVGFLVLVGLTLFVIGSLRPKLAGVYIDSNPPSSVWLNGIKVGNTPYRDTSEPGDTVVKLVADSYGTTLQPYETKVGLIAGVETVIRYDFGGTDDTSAGDIISFEKNELGETDLIAVSIPDLVQLVIDGTERSFTPHKTSSILPGSHELIFSSQGYKTRTVKVNIAKGYKLTAIVKLAKEAIQPTPMPTPTQVQNRDQVEILSTDTGFLRVRNKPSTLGDEIGSVNPGEKYLLIGTDEKTGWYEIEYEPGKDGWISNQYAKKLPTTGFSTPSPSVATQSSQTQPAPTSP